METHKFFEQCNKIAMDEIAKPINSFNNLVEESKVVLPRAEFDDFEDISAFEDVAPIEDVAMRKIDKLEKFFDTLVSVVIPNYKQNSIEAINDLNPVLSLEQDFYEFLKNDLRNYSTEDSVQDLWNSNYLLQANSNEEALRFYLKMRYRIFVEMEAYSDVVNATLDFVLFLSRFERGLCKSEIMLLLTYWEEEWFDKRIISKFSTSSEITPLLLIHLRNGISDENAFLKYYGCNEALTHYLKLRLSNKYIERDFDAWFTHKDAFLEYCNASDVDLPSELLLIVGHHQFKQITQLITGDSNDGHLQCQIYRYKDYFYLYEILLGIQQGYHIEEFVETYLKKDLDTKNFIMLQYSSGKMNQEILQKANFNFYLAELISTATSLSIVTEDNEVVLYSIAEDAEYLMIIGELISNFFLNHITSKSYKQFVLMISIDSTHKLKEIFKGKEFTEFPKFWFGILCEKLSLPCSLSHWIDRNLVIITPDKKAHYASLEDFLVKPERIMQLLEGKCVTATELASASGLCLSTITGISGDQIEYPIISPSSMETLIEEGCVNLKRLTPLNKIFRSNYFNTIVHARHLGIIPSKEAYDVASFETSNYLPCDRCFSYMKTQFPELLFLLSSKKVHTLLPILRNSMCCKTRQDVLFYLLQRFLQHDFKKKVKIIQTNEVLIQEDSILLSGIVNIKRISFESFLQSFDGFCNIFSEAVQIALTTKEKMIYFKVS